MTRLQLLFGPSCAATLKSACEQSDDPRIAFMPVAWRDVDTIGETVSPWLATRAEQPLDGLMALVEALYKQFICGADRTDWRSAWEELLAKAIDKSLRHTPNQLGPEEVVSLLIQINRRFSANKAVPLQQALASLGWHL
jgi:hypothetical protein